MFKTLTKTALIIFAICLMFLSTGCSAEKKFSVLGGPEQADAVSSNGGMVVQKGNYIYYINGVSSTSAENAFGVPQKGTIVRMDLTTLEKLIVVPKVVLSSYNKGGFYIFGDKIYYTSPSVEKDKDGKRLSSYLDYFCCNINGSGTKKIITTISNSNPYKFFENDGIVYLLINDTSNKSVNVINTNTGKNTTILSEYSGTPIVADDGYVYFNQVIYKDEEQKTETYTYNKLCRVAYMGGEIEEIKYPNGDSITQDNLIYCYTATLTDVKIYNDNTVIYYTKKSAVDKGIPSTIPNATPYYYILEEANDNALIGISTDEVNFTNVLYVTETSFIGVYKDSEEEGATGDVYYVEKTQEFNPKKLMANPAKLLNINGEYLYYIKSVDSNNLLYKIKYNREIGEYDPEGEEILADVSFSTSGLSPELVGDFIYFVRTDGDYSNYLYRYDINTPGEDAECISIIADEDVIE